MTAIAAIRCNGRVLIGGDSAGVAGYHARVRKDEKVFRVGAMLIGYTTSFRMAQLIRYGLHDCEHVRDLSPPSDPAHAMEFMVRDFVPRVRWLLDRGGFMRRIDGEEVTGQFIVAWGDRMFDVHADLQVCEPADEFTACGCGQELVLGALAATDCYQAGQPFHVMAAEQRLRIALAAAERFSAGVRGPFTVLST